MDFDELDALEDQERQRWALQELEKVRLAQRKKAAQEQFRFHQQQKLNKPPAAPPQVESDEAHAPAFTSGLASFHLWAQRQHEAAQKPPAPEPVKANSAPEEPSSAPRQRRSRFAEFQQKQQEEETSERKPPNEAASETASVKTASGAKAPGGADPFANYAERLMVQAQADREIDKAWVHQQLSGESLPVHSAATSALPEVEDSEADYVDKVPALNTMITILDKQEEEDKDFERFKPYLPELGEKAPRSIVPVAKDGSNPFITQAVQVFQQYYPDFDLSDAFGDSYKSVLRAASHRAARGGRVEQLQLMNVGMAEEERRLKEERRNLLRDLRRRRYLLQEGQRALGVNLSTTNISKAPPRPLPASAGQAYKAPPSALRLSPGSLGGPVNGLLFPGMDSAEPSPEPELCFPRPPPAEPAPAAAKPPRAKPLGLTASLRLDEDEGSFSIEDLTGLPPPPEVLGAGSRQARPAKTAPSVAPRAQEEADRLRRAAEQAERLERLKERRMQKEKAKAVEAVRAGKGATWGPLGQHLGKSL